MTRFQYIQTNESDAWVKNAIAVLSKLRPAQFREFDEVLCLGVDSIEAIPVRFIQYTNSLIIYKRPSLSADGYEELIKIFAVFVDQYYHTHGNYFRFLDGLKQLQSRRPNSPSFCAFTADIIDMYYMCVMAGKYADRNKSITLNEDAIKSIFADLQNGYNSFSTNAFLAFESACVYATLKSFYKASPEVLAPPYQSAKLILGRVEELTSSSITAVGAENTLSFANKFYNIVVTYLDSSVGDIKPKRKIAGKTIRRPVKKKLLSSPINANER